MYGCTFETENISLETNRLWYFTQNLAIFSRFFFVLVGWEDPDCGNSKSLEH